VRLLPRSWSGIPAAAAPIGINTRHRTVFHILAGVVLVLIALITIGVWMIGTDEDDYRRRRAYGG
jgi:hypothetical protein